MLATDASFWRSPEQLKISHRAREHARRCIGLPPLKPGEAERLVAEYVTKRDGFTQCPTAYLVSVQN